MAPTQQLSAAAHERLTKEHRELTSIGRVEIARKIETARELGDLSENGDYHAAKEEQGKMEGRIMHLFAILDNCEIVSTDPGSDVVATGSIIGIQYEGDDTIERYLVGSVEEKPDGVDVMSPGSPLGACLLGAAAGDTVVFQAPNGELKVTVVEIS